MSTVLSANEVKTNFSNVLATVENDLVTVTIMRYGHPVAQIVPIERHNRTKTNPLLSRIIIKGDPCKTMPSRTAFVKTAERQLRHGLICEKGAASCII